MTERNQKRLLTATVGDFVIAKASRINKDQHRGLMENRGQTSVPGFLSSAFRRPNKNVSKGMGRDDDKRLNSKLDAIHAFALMSG
jgi:hypothetical protein